MLQQQWFFGGYFTEMCSINIHTTTILLVVVMNFVSAWLYLSYI